MKYFLGLILCCLALFGNAQELPVQAEQYIENLIPEDATELSTDDFSEQEEILSRLIRKPVYINGDVTLLLNAGLISSYQMEQLEQYRKVLGDIVDVYELQAVPGWNAQLCRDVKAFVVCEREQSVPLKELVRKGKHTLMIRFQKVMEPARGYLPIENEGGAVYAGSGERVLLKYRFESAKKLQWHLLAEKDPGEAWWQEKKGVDFTSFHVQYKPASSVIQKIILGDYTVNFGTGLIQWQGFSIGSGVSRLKPESESLRPYSGAGEYLFNRGLAVAFKKQHWYMDVFVSYRKLDATIQESVDGNFVSAIRTSGLHRTKSELSGAGIIGLRAMGSRMQYRKHNWWVGLNWVNQQFSMPVQPTDNGYNRFYFSGNALSGKSMDITYFGKFYQFFAEWAFINNASGLSAGVMASLSGFADAGIRYRKFSKSFFGYGNNTFSQNSNGSNEEGIECRFLFKTNKRLTIEAAFDVFRFPYLKYMVNSPSYGREHLLTVQYKPDKKFEAYVLYARKKYMRNTTSEERMPTIQFVVRDRWRLQTQWKVNDAIIFKSRLELVQYLQESGERSDGFLIFADLKYAPIGKSYRFSARWSYFETDNYDSRIYAYENDLYPGNTIPVLYGNGVHVYLNGRFRISRNVTFSLKIARTTYFGNDATGSGYEEIKGNTRTRAGFQLNFGI